MSLILTKFFNAAYNQGKRVCTILAFGRGDVRTAQEIGPYGTDSCPIPKILAIYSSTAIHSKAFILGYLNKQQLADTGEYRTYSTDAEGNLKTYIWLKNNGDILLGGDDDNAVRYSKLEEAFNQLKNDHDILAGKYNQLESEWSTFAAAYVAGSPTVTGMPVAIVNSTTSASDSTADITPAKIEQIKVPLNNPEI